MDEDQGHSAVKKAKVSTPGSDMEVDEDIEPEQSAGKKGKPRKCYPIAKMTNCSTPPQPPGKKRALPADIEGDGMAAAKSIKIGKPHAARRTPTRPDPHQPEPSSKASGSRLHSSSKVMPRQPSRREPSSAPAQQKPKTTASGKGKGRAITLENVNDEPKVKANQKGRGGVATVRANPEPKPTSASNKGKGRAATVEDVEDESESMAEMSAGESVEELNPKANGEHHGFNHQRSRSKNPIPKSLRNGSLGNDFSVML